MPSAFVTGGTGFVGLNLIAELSAQGWQVTACHRGSSELERIRRWQPRLVPADVLDPEALLAAMPERPDAVFHLAASVSFWRPHDAQRLNHLHGVGITAHRLEGHDVPGQIDDVLPNPLGIH